MKTSASAAATGSAGRDTARARLRHGRLLLLALAVAGCSALPLLYERGPKVALWWLDDYLELDAAQRAATRTALAEWFRWHRATQLLPYADALAAWRRDAAGDLEASEICAMNDALREHFRAGLRHALPAAAGLAFSLDAKQRAHLALRFDESNEERREEELGGTPAAQRARHTDEAIDRAQSLYGRLDRAQRALIARRIAHSPYDAHVRLAERAARQRDTLDALARIAALPAAGRDAAALAILETLAESYLHSPRPAYRAYYAKLAAYNCAFIAEVHNGTNAKQRAKAQRKLRGWEEDFRSLAGNAP
ncbi:MAG TPA: DUF6279 family lipoprotein [Gammaproteobacteria bacterium]|nr:DUF6279 family lipoprotein [Gammaproteobacteria bacterium]